MRADNTPIDPGPEPAWFAELLIGAGVLVFAERDYLGDGKYSQTALDLTYEGYEDDLLSAEVITDAMLVLPGKGSHYRDPSGRSVRIWGCRVSGTPLRYMTVKRRMSIEELPRGWPAGPEALTAFDRHLAWSTAQSEFLRLGGRALRAPFVVDNTKEGRP